MKEIYDFLKACPCYFIATMDGNQPRVRPFGTILLFEDKLYIQSGHKKDFAKQLSANPKMELSAFDGKGNWIRLSATMVEDNRVETKKAMLDDYPSLRAMYDENDDNTAVWYMTNAKGSICSFTAAPKEFSF